MSTLFDNTSLPLWLWIVIIVVGSLCILGVTAVVVLCLVRRRRAAGSVSDLPTRKMTVRRGRLVPTSNYLSLTGSKFGLNQFDEDARTGGARSKSPFEWWNTVKEKRRSHHDDLYSDGSPESKAKLNSTQPRERPSPPVSPTTEKTPTAIVQEVSTNPTPSPIERPARVASFSRPFNPSLYEHSNDSSQSASKPHNRNLSMIKEANSPHNSVIAPRNNLERRSSQLSGYIPGESTRRDRRPSQGNYQNRQPIIPRSQRSSSTGNGPRRNSESRPVDNRRPSGQYTDNSHPPNHPRSPHRSSSGDRPRRASESRAAVDKRRPSNPPYYNPQPQYSVDPRSRSIDRSRRTSDSRPSESRSRPNSSHRNSGPTPNNRSRPSSSHRPSESNPNNRSRPNSRPTSLSRRASNDDRSNHQVPQPPQQQPYQQQYQQSYSQSGTYPQPQSRPGPYPQAQPHQRSQNSSTRPSPSSSRRTSDRSGSSTQRLNPRQQTSSTSPPIPAQQQRPEVPRPIAYRGSRHSLGEDPMAAHPNNSGTALSKRSSTHSTSRPESVVSFSDLSRELSRKNSRPKSLVLDVEAQPQLQGADYYASRAEMMPRGRGREEVQQQPPTPTSMGSAGSARAPSVGKRSKGKGNVLRKKSLKRMEVVSFVGA